VLRRRLVQLALIVAALALIGNVVLAQSRRYRVAPGPVRFEAVSLTGDALVGFVNIDGKPAHVTVLTAGRYTIEARAMGYPLRGGELEVVGSPVRQMQTVKVRLLPWTRQRVVETATIGWAELKHLSATREVTVRTTWPDAGVAADVVVKCGDVFVRTDDFGSARCGRMQGDVLVLAWRDEARTTSALVRDGEGEVTLSVEP
jgi:hypothetical protein